VNKVVTVTHLKGKLDSAQRFGVIFVKHVLNKVVMVTHLKWKLCSAEGFGAMTSNH
jgi:hypothetical protein